MIGKFSIRTVPDQEPEQIVSLTEGYLRKLWSTRGSPNKMSVRGEGERGWLADTNTVNFKAASRFGTCIFVLSWGALKGSLHIIKSYSFEAILILALSVI